MMPLTVRLFFSLVTLFSLSVASLAADEHQEINLWPSGSVPDEPEGIEKRKKPTTVDKVGKMRIAYVDTPSITVYEAPKDKSNGTAVVISRAEVIIFWHGLMKGLKLQNGLIL